ncbi:glycosyltransferase [Paenibacillus sp. sgz500958]|uniref:glycosyltransferase n=1 Tax=Paenibacillus sp. sgz500958 TaxID=3242475 RepID=UPI0036D40223
MSDVLIASYDMEVGGVERSLAAMLEHFDYTRYAVDLMLYRHQGDLLPLISDAVNLLPENPAYATFRQSIPAIIRQKHYGIAWGRILAKVHGEYVRLTRNMPESGYYQMQLMWRYTLAHLPRLERSYDVAISYLWPHDFVAHKVQAKVKIAWIHTDYSTIETDKAMDYAMWSRFDWIVAVSDACQASFLDKYPELKDKVIVIENITSPEFIHSMAEENMDNPMNSDNSFKLATVGRLSYQKGFDQAIQALRLLHDRGYTDIRWYVVGYGGDEAALRDLIAQNNLTEDFILLGKHINPYPFVKACDLYVQPSRYEGKAVTVTEAKILGKPVLITNYATAPSQIEDGVDGCIAELSVQGIADGIERLYHDEALRRRIADYCANYNHVNTDELRKLYSRMNSGEDAVRNAL